VRPTAGGATSDNRPLIRLRRAAVAISMLIAIVALSGIGRLHFNSHYSAYFDPEDPRLLQHNALSDIYDRHDAVVVLLVSHDGSLLTEPSYTTLEDLTSTLGMLPYVANAVSITELGIVGEFETASGALLPSSDQLRRHDRAIGLLLSAEETVAAIRVEYALPDNDARTVLRTLSALRSVVDERIAGLPISAHYTGTLALNEAYIQVVRHDLAIIAPLLLAVMFLVLALLLGNLRAVVSVFPVGLMSVAGAFGIAGLLGAELAAIDTFVPVIILSISLAGCVHLALSYEHYRQDDESPASAALAALRFNLLPMSLANLTTAIGFMGLLFSPSPPVRIVGYVVATGVTLSFMLCTTLLPVIQVWLDPWRTTTTRQSWMLAGVTSFVHRYRIAIVAACITALLPAGWLASRNVISDNVFEYFPESHDFHRDTRLVEEHLSGINELMYSLDFGRPDGLFDVSAVDALDSFADWLTQQPETIRVTSISGNSAIREARQEGRLEQRLRNYRRLSRDSRPDSPLILNEVSSDYSSTLISVYLRRLDSAELVAFDQRAQNRAREIFGARTLASGGATLIFAYLGERNILGMLTALTIALVVAALVLGLVHRSLRIAIIGLVCNILPVLLVYSVWAVTNGRISIGAAVVMGMILGIVIDDTIYLLSTYRRGQIARIDSPASQAVKRVGPALVITTVTLVGGLSLGLLSDFGPIWSMSALSVTIIGLALIIDLVLLPAMLPADSSNNIKTARQNG